MRLSTKFLLILLLATTGLIYTLIKLIEDGLSVKNIIEKTGVTKSYVSQIKKSLQKA